MTAADSPIPDYLALADEALLGQCRVHIYRSSGPGGQHRNKASTAVRLQHPPTGISAHGDEWRSQLQNKQQALARLRMAIACQLRRPMDPGSEPPEVVASCLHVPKGTRDGEAPAKRLSVGRKDARFWPVAQYLLDLLDAHAGRLAEAAGALGITTSNLASVLKDNRHLFAAAGAIRKRHNQGPLK